MRDRRERFVGLAEARVRKAAQVLRLIGNLSNRHNYEYTAGDVQEIISALEAEMKLLRAKFQTELSRQAKEDFTLGKGRR
jgi:hypothetical protein